MQNYVQLTPLVPIVVQALKFCSFTLYNDPRDFLEDGEKSKWVLSKGIHG